jgi:hypothetical protein
MAEYYPLLAKAVAGLPNSTPETRRAVYERARKALIAQLQNLQPPVPAAELARETRALDNAMARLEAELRAPNKSAAGAPRPQPQPAPAKRLAPNAADWQAPTLPRAPGAGRAPNEAPPARVEAPNDPKNAPSNTKRPQPNEKPTAPRDEPHLVHPELVRPDAVRPLAPHPEADDAPQGRRLWIVVAVVVVVVAAVAATAWKLRDRPEDFSAFKPATQNQADQSSAKIVQRIGGSALQPSSQQPSTNLPTAAAAPAAAGAAGSGQATAPQSTPDNSSVPVAYRAALLVAAPEEQNKVKTYVGTVIWHLENVSNDAGQPATAVRADIDVPDDKLKASLEIQKNTDPSLSASHTMTIVFTVAPGSPTGSVKQISLPQLRDEDSPNGESLRGSLVPIMENSFLIGLTRGEAEAANIGLLKQREWFDIPILLADGRVAKLTFEKNASGDRAVSDALVSWQAQQ